MSINIFFKFILNFLIKNDVKTMNLDQEPDPDWDFVLNQDRASVVSDSH